MNLIGTRSQIFNTDQRVSESLQAIAHMVSKLQQVREKRANNISNSTHSIDKIGFVHKTFENIALGPTVHSIAWWWMRDLAENDRDTFEQLGYAWSLLKSSYFEF